MDNSKLPKGQSGESNGQGKPRNLPGIYRHEAAGKEIITVADQNDGSIQADALVRVGYHRIGDVPSRIELNAMRDAQLKKDEEAAKAGKTSTEPEQTTVVPNGTTQKSATELQEELDATKATLSALQEGMNKKK